MPASDLPTPDATAALLRSRRTIHLFDAERPPEEPVLRALDLARWAPNHRLTEPWRFYLLGPETAARIVDLNARIVAEQRGEAAGQAKRERWGAIPGWLVLTCRTSEDPLRAREDFAACACALQNLQLYLWSEGIGTKWTTGAVTRHDDFYRILGIDAAEETVVGLVWYGYPTHVPAPPRQPLANVLTRRP